MPGKTIAGSNIVYTENATNKTKSKGDQLRVTSGRGVEVSKHQEYVSRVRLHRLDELRKACL
jgi:hypothetical protein